jgi:hypothetical protein
VCAPGPSAAISIKDIERDYVLAAIDSDLFWLESAHWPYRNPFFYGNSVDPVVYLTVHSKPLHPGEPQNRRSNNQPHIYPTQETTRVHLPYDSPSKKEHKNH